MEMLKHECGVAMVRLLKPLAYYRERYGTWRRGLDELYLLMEKEHNRGQEGAGLACVRLSAVPGEEYMFRERAEGTGAIEEVFSNVANRIREAQEDTDDIRCLPFAGEIYMGHLRYSTTGRSGLSYVHPFLRRNNWRARNLCLCGNFNMTNADVIKRDLVSRGQHPRAEADTFLLLEQTGHQLDRENERLYAEAKDRGLEYEDVTRYIESGIDMGRVLREASRLWDGGYVICGMTGSGEMFAMRDPWGIRPVWWYRDEEQVVVASERAVIQTTVFCADSDVVELLPGEALMVRRNGEFKLEQILPPLRKASCSFERIYFSRGNDADIYKERKALGRGLVEKVGREIDDLQHTVFSFIPNTAEVAFYGLVEGFNDLLRERMTGRLLQMGKDMSEAGVREVLKQRVRVEKVAWKDIKMRTFIAEGASRKDLAGHVYDVTYGSLEAGVDTLVIIDDSIVRGTTLKESILRILDRLQPKKIVVVSSAPQIRYPDYYGIDMSHVEEFIAFRAAIEVLKERGMEHVLRDTYDLCRHQLSLPEGEMVNGVKMVYSTMSDDDISEKMAVMLRSEGVKAEIAIVFQSVEGLHEACPDSAGDWYFSGDYPTPGGVRRVNQAYVDFYERVYMKP